jgi:diaminopropionate ammonia-lyase
VHRRLPGYAATPLREAPELATELGIGRLLVKDESSRLGLPAFKILGVAWACYQALQQRLEHPVQPWRTVEELAAQLAMLRPLTLAAATDGNHGRAVARMAALLGLEAQIFVPAGTAAARIAAIEQEGALCSVVDGGYDDAVARSAQEASQRCLVISDTSWPGYVDIPRWVIEGYSTICFEVDDQLAAGRLPTPDLVVAQIGVGALAAALARHYRGASGSQGPRLLGVEPLTAACVLESVAAGAPVVLPGEQNSIMAGLNCGTPSPIAWPYVSGGYDVFCAVGDDRARQAMRDLAAAGVVAGETGAAGLAGLTAVCTEPAAAAARSALQIGPGSCVLVLCTEGATDPASYWEIVGRSAADVRDAAGDRAAAQDVAGSIWQ